MDKCISPTFPASIESRPGHVTESCQLNVSESGRVPALIHVVLERLCRVPGNKTSYSQKVFELLKSVWAEPGSPHSTGLNPFTVVGNHCHCINIQRLGTLAPRITEPRRHMPVTGAAESRSNCSLLSASLLACSEWEKVTFKHVFPRPSLSCRGKQTARAGRLWSRRVRQPGGIWTQCVPGPTCL